MANEQSPNISDKLIKNITQKKNISNEIIKQSGHEQSMNKNEMLTERPQFNNRIQEEPN